MIKVGDKVAICQPKAKRPQWRNNEGTVVQILDAHNSFTNKDEKVHIVRLANGQENPVDETCLTQI